MRAERTAARAVLCGALWCAAPAAAQDGFEVVDRVAAVVGSTPIPFSRVQENVNVVVAEMRRSGQEPPSDPAWESEMRRRVLDQLIDTELLLQQAAQDTLVRVSDQEIEASADQALREIRAQYPSEQEYRRQLRLAGFATPEEYRRYIVEERRREMLVQEVMRRLRERGEIRSVSPTERELRDYFESTRPQHPRRPSTVTFRQVVVRPVPSPEAVARAFTRADSLLRELRGGADFATLARRYSDDPGSQETGGDLGWFRRGVMVREFEQVAFRIRPGAVSEPVQTVFGFHLIQVQRVEPAEVQARHILIAPEITDADLEAARRRADSVANALRSGASIDTLTRRYHEPLFQTRVEGVEPGQLSPALKAALDAVEPGDVAGPVELQQGALTGFAVVRLLDRSAEGEYTFEELRDVLRSGLAEEQSVRRYLDGLRRRVYVDIRI